jgi:hypothetical protein
MNGKRTLGTFCAVAASLVHLSADAASGQKGLEACASALALELSEARGGAVQVRLGDESDVSNRRLANRTIYHLDAHNAANREIVAKVDCTVDARARVKSLVRLPEGAPDAAERSL